MNSLRIDKYIDRCFDYLKLDTYFVNFDRGIIRAFVCYSSRDSAACELVIKCLKTLSNPDEMTFWVDAKDGVVGEPFLPTILEAISRSTCAILLISRNCLVPNGKGENFIRDIELPRILKRFRAKHRPMMILPLLIDAESKDDLVDKLGLGSIQHALITFNANQNAVAVDSLMKMKTWLGRRRGLIERRQLRRRSFSGITFYTAVLALLVSFGLFSPDSCSGLNSITASADTFGIQQIPSKLGLNSEPETPYFVTILRTNVERRVMAASSNSDLRDDFVLSTAESTFDTSNSSVLWIKLLANVTAVVAGPDLRIVHSDDERNRSGLVVLTPEEFRTKRLQDIYNLSLIFCAIIVGVMIISTIRSQVILDKRILDTVPRFPQRFGGALIGTG